MKTSNLFEQLNLWDVARDGLILGCSGEVSLLYRIIPSIDVEMSGDHEERNWLQSARGLLALLPAQSAVSFFIDMEDIQSPQAAALQVRAADCAQDSIRELLAVKAKSLGQKQRSRSYYMALSLYRRNFLKLPFLARVAFPSNWGANSIARRHDELKAELTNLDGLMCGQAPGIGAKLESLSREEVLSFYWKRLNPAKARADVPFGATRKALTLRSQIALSPSREENGSFWMDGFYHKTVSLYSFGEHVELGSMDRLLSKLPVGASLSVNILALDLEAALENAKTQARRSVGLSFLQGSKNYEAVARSGELDELITLVRSQAERLYLFSLSVLIRAEDVKTADDTALKVQMLFRECLGAEGLVEDLLHRRLFFGALPLGATAVPRRHTLTGEACSHVLPLSAPWSGNAGDQGMILKTREGEMITFDPFDGGSPRHGIVVGSTGSGKSFAMNYLVLSLFAADPKTSFVIIDVGGSYRRLCDILGGNYFEIKLSDRYAINLFPVQEAVKAGDGEFDADQLGFLCLLLEKMLTDRLSQNKKRILENALRQLYGKPWREAPILADFISILENPEDESDAIEAKDMARALRFYTEGIYGKVLNQPSNLKLLDKRLTVFDLARLKEHKELQAIIVFLIGFGLGQQMGERQAKKIIVFDEAWEFFNDPVASELISRLYRTARKYNAAILSVSQSPVDFLKSHASTAMLANSFWKIFLRLDMGHEKLAAFGLNLPQIEAVKSLSMQRRKYSEMLLTWGPKSRVVRVEPTALEYWIATTNAEECALEDEYAKQHKGDRFSLVKAMAEKEALHAA